MATEEDKKKKRREYDASKIEGTMLGEMNGAAKAPEPDGYESFVSTLPENQRRPSPDYDMRRYWELNGRPSDFEQAKQIGMFRLDKTDGLYHASTVAYNKDADEYEFMKLKNHPTVGMELDWYNSDDPEAVQFRRDYELTDSGDRYRYVRRKAQPVAPQTDAQPQQPKVEPKPKPEQPKKTENVSMTDEISRGETPQAAPQPMTREQMLYQRGYNAAKVPGTMLGEMNGVSQDAQPQGGSTSMAEEISRVEQAQNAQKAPAQSAAAPAQQNIYDASQIAGNLLAEMNGNGTGQGEEGSVSMTEEMSRGAQQGEFSESMHTENAAQEGGQDVSEEKGGFDALLDELNSRVTDSEGRLQNAAEYDKAQQKREKARLFVAGLGDVLASVANLVGTAYGAENQNQTYATPLVAEAMEKRRTERRKYMDSIYTDIEKQRKALLDYQIANDPNSYANYLKAQSIENRSREIARLEGRDATYANVQGTKANQAQQRIDNTKADKERKGAQKDRELDIRQQEANTREWKAHHPTTRASSSSVTTTKPPTYAERKNKAKANISDAYLEIARHFGFNSWEEAKAYIGSDTHKMNTISEIKGASADKVVEVYASIYAPNFHNKYFPKDEKPEEEKEEKKVGKDFGDYKPRKGGRLDELK